MNPSRKYCARFLVEASSPLKIGTGEKGLIADSLAAADANGLPYIPGTAICGVLRHAFGSGADRIFGFQESGKGEGSRIVFSDARFVGKDGEVIDGLAGIDFDADHFYRRLKSLAMRDHCRIDHRGTADRKEHGKFDSQAVFKGCRFVFDMELTGDDSLADAWHSLLGTMASPLFRIGGGTRKGFGELAVIAKDERVYRLEDKKDLDDYLSRSSKLKVPAGAFSEKASADGLTRYELSLAPDDFFLFSSGSGNERADSAAKKETCLKWEKKDGKMKPSFDEEKVLIPASSVKGALSHRTAFHYNRLNGIFADRLPDGKMPEDVIGAGNPAVKALFGSLDEDGKGVRGRVMLSDLFLNERSRKIFNHAAIDRFTGGALDGALFSEEAVSTDGFTIAAAVDESAFAGDPSIQKAFECALRDIATGMLPLGGSTMRGHGCFSGTIMKNGEAL